MSDPTSNTPEPTIWGPLGRKLYEMNPNRPPSELVMYGITPTSTAPDAGGFLNSPDATAPKTGGDLYPPEGS